MVKEHFNQTAKKWDSKEKVDRMEAISSKVVEILKLDTKIDILDFGCGTGLFGLHLSPFIKSLIGLDSSEEMLSIFNKKTEGLDNISCENCSIQNFQPKQNFDLIISSMVFHHLENPEETLSYLKKLINKNGRIAIVDLQTEDGNYHPNNSEMGVKHFGFNKETIKSWAEIHNLKYSFHVINQISKNSKNYFQFLAVFHKKLD